MHTDNRLPCESIPGLGYLSDSILNILIGKFKLKVLEKPIFSLYKKTQILFIKYIFQNSNKNSSISSLAKDQINNRPIQIRAI